MTYLCLCSEFLCRLHVLACSFRCDLTALLAGSSGVFCSPLRRKNYFCTSYVPPLWRSHSLGGETQEGDLGHAWHEQSRFGEEQNPGFSCCEMEVWSLPAHSAYMMLLSVWPGFSCSPLSSKQPPSFVLTFAVNVFITLSLEASGRTCSRSAREKTAPR
jgi:hypothetical protein